MPYQKRLLPGLEYKIEGEKLSYNHKSIGEISYIRFHSTIKNINKSCFFFYFTRHGTELVDGWYCAAADRPLENDTIADVIQSIDLDWDPTKAVEKRTVAEPNKPKDAAATATSTVAPAPAEASAAASEKHPIAVIWEGYENPLIVSVAITGNNSGGTMAVKNPFDGSECNGSYVVGRDGRGTWSLACATGLTASGTLQTLGTNQGTKGDGRDSNGRAMKFTLAPRE